MRTNVRQSENELNWENMPCKFIEQGPEKLMPYQACIKMAQTGIHVGKEKLDHLHSQLVLSSISQPRKD